MEREEEGLPPGFRRITRNEERRRASSMAIDASLGKGKRKELFQSSRSGEVNTLNIKIRMRAEEINPNRVTPKSEVIEDDEGSNIEGDSNGTGAIVDEDCGDVSFRSENKVYTLCKAPCSNVLTGTANVDTASILSVKNGLRSYLLTASPNDVALMITQANNIFAFLQALNADYRTFYNNVRAYICHCVEWYAAEQELIKCKQSENLVSRYDQLVHQSIEAKKVVSDIEDDLMKAKMYMAPLEARIQDMKELLEKLELELGERKTDLTNLEAKKTQKTEVIATLDFELKLISSDAGKTRNMIRDNTDRREKARTCMEKARNQLEIM